MTHLLWISGLAVLLLVGCASPNAPDRMGLPGDSHEYFSDEMQAIMQRMNRMVYEREVTDLDLQEIRVRDARLLSAMADELAVVTLQLFDDDLSHRDANTLLFEQYVSELREATGEVGRLASGGTPQELSVALDRVRATCEGCHASYRDRMGGGS